MVHVPDGTSSFGHMATPERLLVATAGPGPVSGCLWVLGAGCYLRSIDRQADGLARWCLPVVGLSRPASRTLSPGRADAADSGSPAWWQRRWHSWPARPVTSPPGSPTRGGLRRPAAGGQSFCIRWYVELADRSTPVGPA